LHPPVDCRLNSLLHTTTNVLFPPPTYITKNRLSHVKLRERRHYDQGEVVNNEFVKMTDAHLKHSEDNLQHYGTFVRKGESAVLPWLFIDVHTRFTISI